MGTAQVESTSALVRMRTNRSLDGMRNNRYRLPAKFYFILWLTLWVSAVGSFLLGVWESLDVAMDANNGPGPQCGAIAVGRFWTSCIHFCPSQAPWFDIYEHHCSSCKFSMIDGWSERLLEVKAEKHHLALYGYERAFESLSVNKSCTRPICLSTTGDARVFRVDLTPLTEVYLGTRSIVMVVQWLVFLPTRPPP